MYFKQCRAKVICMCRYLAMHIYTSSERIQGRAPLVGECTTWYVEYQESCMCLGWTKDTSLVVGVADAAELPWEPRHAALQELRYYAAILSTYAAGRSFLPPCCATVLAQNLFHCSEAPYYRQPGNEELFLCVYIIAFSNLRGRDLVRSMQHSDVERDPGVCRRARVNILYLGIPLNWECMY